MFYKSFSSFIYSMALEVSMKRRRLVAAENGRLLEDFYENKDTEGFPVNNFVGEDNPVGEQDCS